MRRKRLVERTSRRRVPREKTNYRRFMIFILICIAVVSILSAKFPVRLWEHAEPGTINEASGETSGDASSEVMTPGEDLSWDDIPEFSGEPYVEINGNIPTFTKEEEELLSSPGYEFYSALDMLGRCGYAEACVGPETMPEGEERGEIWTVHPSGWKSGQGWERCHLIGWALTAENANDHNLVTGTHYMNVDGMLPFEIEVAEAGDKGRHTMYRVTPIYNGQELVARGVHMMAKSVEDDSVSYNIFVYNVDPGKTVDYFTGYIY